MIGPVHRIRASYGCRLVRSEHPQAAPVYAFVNERCQYRHSITESGARGIRILWVVDDDVRKYQMDSSLTLSTHTHDDTRKVFCDFTKQSVNRIRVLVDIDEKAAWI